MKWGPIGHLAFFLLLVAPPAAHAGASAQERLARLAEEYVNTSVRFDPLRATALGIPGHDGELPAPGEAARAAQIARLRGWKRELDSIARAAGAGMSLVEQDDSRLLRANFDSELNELLVRQSDRRNYCGPTLALNNALFQQFLNLPVAGREGAAATDVDRAWADITARLAKGPAYIAGGQRLATHPGRLFATVGSRELAGIPEFLGGALTDAAKSQLAHDPDALQRFEAARDALLSTVAATRAHVDAHAKAWPENFAIGRKAYEQMLHDEQLLPFGGAEIERIGRDELAHGWAEEAWLRALSAERKLAFGAPSGGGMAPAGPALVGYYRERIAELRAFIDQVGVVTVPDWLGAMEIIETPAFLQPVTPGASMNPPRTFSPSTTGYYFITPPSSLDEAAARLDMNEDFDRDRILSTAAHEAMPGHFLQLSIARRHPDFVRKIQNDTAFEEGWAFYGEEMFVRLGLYRDDLDARLFTARWERVRGARAIVDVKLASGEWTVAQAVDFFFAQSGFTREASEAAIAGYALQPGYYINYSVGRFQLETLLAEYLRRTGEQGSLRDFHDRLLSYGSVPFSIVAPELLADLEKPASAVRAAANY